MHALVIQTDQELKTTFAIWRIFFNGFLVYFADVICLDSDLEVRTIYLFTPYLSIRQSNSEIIDQFTDSPV